MSTARKYSSNGRSMSSESRHKAYGAINILWLQMRHDLRFEDKETIREERLGWIAAFLGIKKLDSTTDLSDAQIGKVLDEMKRLTGQASKKGAKNTTKSQNNNNSLISDNVVFLSAHRASEEQKFTINKIIEYIGWNDEQKTNWLQKRKFPAEIHALPFKKATALTMILLNIAAQKDLKAKGETKITRQMKAKYIPVLKKKLGIDQ